MFYLCVQFIAIVDIGYLVLQIQFGVIAIKVFFLNGLLD